MMFSLYIFLGPDAGAVCYSKILVSSVQKKFANKTLERQRLQYAAVVFVGSCTTLPLFSVLHPVDS